MKRFLFFMGLAWCGTLLAQVQPGQWELTVTGDMEGKPLGPAKRQQCFSEEDARNPERVLGASGTCEFSNRQELGGTLIFDVKCGGALPMSGRGRIRHDADTFEGDLDLTVEAQGATPSMGLRTKISGKRLGAC
jgi:hypothetical protein